AMDPEKVGGCGAQPGGAANRQQSRIDGTSAWPDQLPIWLTPHGFLRLADSEETSVEATDRGVKVSVRVPRGDSELGFDRHVAEDRIVDPRLDALEPVALVVVAVYGVDAAARTSSKEIDCPDARSETNVAPKKRRRPRASIVPSMRSSGGAGRPRPARRSSKNEQSLGHPPRRDSRTGPAWPCLIGRERESSERCVSPRR